MSKQEDGRQINITLTIPNLRRLDRRAFLVLGGAGLIGGVLVLKGGETSKPLLGFNPEQPNPIPVLGPALEKKEEEQDTNTAEKFMLAVFSGNVDEVVRLYHPDMQAQFRNFSSSQRAQFTELLGRFSDCKGAQYKKENYEKYDNGERVVSFEFERLCGMSMILSRSGKPTLNVWLRAVKGGGYAPTGMTNL